MTLDSQDRATPAPARAVIIVVAKAPQVGQVKTRLCPPLSYEQAARLYRGILLDTIEIALSLTGCDVKVVCPSPQDARALRQLLPDPVGYVIQQTPASGLTGALTQAIEESLAAGYPGVFCISSDNPTLPPEYLEAALTALAVTDLVFGPAEDGGYYLIGAKAPCRYLFEGMTWSTATVLAETLQRAEQAGAACHLLPPWYDLDTGQELARLVAELAASPAPARHTRQALDGLNYHELLNAPG